MKSDVSTLGQCVEYSKWPNDGLPITFFHFWFSKLMCTTAISRKKKLQLRLPREAYGTHHSLHSTVALLFSRTFTSVIVTFVLHCPGGTERKHTISNLCIRQMQFKKSTSTGQVVSCILVPESLRSRNFLKHRDPPQSFLQALFPV